MKRQHLLLGGGAALLVALNLWQWLPSGDSPTSPASPRAAGTFQPDDFRLRMTASVPTEPGAGRRDLFQPKRPPAPPVKKVEAPQAPPPKTPEQLAEEAARAEFAQIKLVGVVFRGKEGQAFLVKGDQVFLAEVGDKVGQRFTVESIGTDKVQLKDSSTNVSGQIPVSGK